MRPGIVAQPSPGIQPLLVRMDSDGSLYLDSEPVTWKEFPAVLQTKLNQRPPKWPVYFMGDPNLEWQWPLKAIDIIRGLQAEVFLLKAVPPTGNLSPTRPAY
jgi:biopolymer transport protein ExbD